MARGSNNGGFDKVADFSRPAAQRSLSPSQDSYTGNVLFYWRVLLGLEPPPDQWSGLRIQFFGKSSDSAKSGNAEGSLLSYVKQVELDLADLKNRAADTNTLLTSIESKAARANTLLASIEAQTITSTALLASIESRGATTENQLEDIKALLSQILAAL